MIAKRLIASKLLFLLTIVGLTTGCSVQMSSQHDVEPSLVSSPIPSPLPTQTIALETAIVPVEGRPETLVEQSTPGAPPPAERQPPPARDDPSPPSPAEMARFDLADYLHTDVAWVQVVDVVVREPDAEVMSCLGNEPLFEKLWGDDQVTVQVDWISLSVKGNIYHYVALGDRVTYCDETADGRQ